MAQIYTLNGQRVYDDRGQTINANTGQVVQRAFPSQQQTVQQPGIQQISQGIQVAQQQAGTIQRGITNLQQSTQPQSSPQSLPLQQFQDPYTQFNAERRARGNAEISQQEYYAQNPGSLQSLLSQLGFGQQKESPETTQLRSQQQATLDRLIGLQGELEKLRAPSPELQELKRAIGQQQQALKDLTPAKYLQTQPGLRNVGITQGFLERRVAQEREPIAGALQNLLYSESILSDEEQRRRQALGQQAELSQTEFGLRKELMGLQPKPYQLPEGIQSKLLERFLFPEQQKTPKGFELSPGQARFEYNQQTGKFEQIANVPSAKGVPPPGIVPEPGQISPQVQSYIDLIKSGRASFSSVPAGLKDQVAQGLAEQPSPVTPPRKLPTGEFFTPREDISKSENQKVNVIITGMDFINQAERLYNDAVGGEIGVPILGGILGRLKGLSRTVGMVTGTNEAFNTYIRFLNSNRATIAKGIKGEVGNLAETEQKNALKSFPSRFSSPIEAKSAFEEIRIQMKSQLNALGEVASDGDDLQQQQSAVSSYLNSQGF